MDNAWENLFDTVPQSLTQVRSRLSLDTVPYSIVIQVYC